MSVTLELPANLENQFRAQAIAEGMQFEQYLTAHLLRNPPIVNGSQIPDDMIDHEYHAELDKEFDNDTTPVPTIEEVRKILSKISGSMTADFIAERDERF